MSKRIIHFSEINSIYERHFKPILDDCCLQHEVVTPNRQGAKSCPEMVILAVAKPEKMDKLRDINTAWGRVKYGNSFPRPIVELGSPGGFKVFIHFVSRDQYGIELLRLTGPTTFWYHIIEALKSRGIEYEAAVRSLFKGGEKMSTMDEDRVFDLAAIRPVPPDKRK
jgi:hypothetical protein